jgi:hypothetical protein
MDIDGRTHRLDRLHKNSLADGTRQKSVNDQKSAKIPRGSFWPIPSATVSAPRVCAHR